MNNRKLAFYLFISLVFITTPVVYHFSSSAMVENREMQFNLQSYVSPSITEAFNINSLKFYVNSQEIRDMIFSKLNAIAATLKQNMVLAEKKKIIEERVEKVEQFFASYNGGAVLKGYGRIIVEEAERCGGDYRILVGIAGIESGLGRVPYLDYNPYGYLNGVRYSGWEESLRILSCEISTRFLKPCNNDLDCIINRYGGPDTDKEHWLRSVRWFMSNV